MSRPDCIEPPSAWPMLHAMREAALMGAEIAGTEALARYLRVDMGYRPGERLRVLFLVTATGSLPTR